MLEFANKTELTFEPGSSGEFLIDSTPGTGVQYQTPDALKEQLGDLARLSYITGRLKVKVVLNQATAAGAATVRIRAGGVEIGSVDLDLTTGQKFYSSVDVELMSVLASSLLDIQFDVTTVADAGTKADIAATLQLTHPVVVLGGV